MRDVWGPRQSLNLYSYVENNPTTMGDPDGHLGSNYSIMAPGGHGSPACYNNPNNCTPEAQTALEDQYWNKQEEVAQEEATKGMQEEETDDRSAAMTVTAQNNGTDTPNTNSSSSNSDSGVGKSVTKGYKWYKFITGWFNKGMEAKKLKDEMQSDRQIRDIAAGAVMSMSPRTPAQFGEIWQLEEQNLLLDTGRQIGKIMGEVPNIPGEDKFGEAVFNAYGRQRDANNNRIDTLLQEAAASLTPQ